MSESRVQTEIDERQLIRQKLRLSQTLSRINRDYADNTGILTDKQLQIRMNGKKFDISTGIVKSFDPYGMYMEAVRRYTIMIDGNIYRTPLFGKVIHNKLLNREYTSFNDESAVPFLEYRRIISKNAKSSEFRKMSRKINRKIRRGLKEQGIHVTPHARLMQAWRIGRNAAAIAGTAYGASAGAYKIAEHFLTLPQIPIFP